MAALEIKNLNFSYPNQDGSGSFRALKDINLKIDNGEFILVCGPSGCGKSTLLRQIKPVLRPFGSVSGQVLIDGRSVDELNFREQTEMVGFVMQNPEMQIVTDKVWHELAFGLESLGISYAYMRVMVADISSYIGILRFIVSNTSDISGGQKQLLCLAAVMAMQPKIILLDEPTSQLDPIAAGEFFSALKRINEEIGTTVIITEHRYEGLFSLVDRVAFMNEGRIIGCGRPREAIAALADHPQFKAILPSSMRLYAEIEPEGVDAPITVREGRHYLASLTDKGKIGVRKLDERNIYCPKKNDAQEAIISVRDCWFRYVRNGPDVLKGFSFDVYPSELTCIIGGNGSGKTTAIMNASGLYKPYRGKVKFKGKDIKSYKNSGFYGKQVSLLVQNPECCFIKDTVREELESVCKNFGLNGARLDEIIDLLELKPILDRHPYDVSGGELQRAAIARLMLPGPQVIFLDEATKGMDAFFKRRFGGLLRRLTAGGVSIVLVSHDIEFCAEFADRCAMFFDGRITAEGSSREVLLDNSFYTTSANRISRGITESALTVSELIEIIK